MPADITYRLVTPTDRDQILEFLRKYFYPEEPLTIASEPLEIEIYDEEANKLNIETECETCVIAISGDQIVGVLLASSKGTDEEKLLLEEAYSVPGTKWAKMMIFLAALERDSNVYEKYNVDKAIHGHVLSVHKDFRGKGIGRKLYEKSMERARELGYELYSTDCSSVYSAFLCERLGMDCVNVCSFADYRAPGSDEQVFFPPGEHKFVKTFAKRLL